MFGFANHERPPQDGTQKVRSARDAYQMAIERLKLRSAGPCSACSRSLVT